MYTDFECVLCKYIVKPPNCPQSGFAWHRDSDWCNNDEICNRISYISLWCALDDMTSGARTDPMHLHLLSMLLQCNAPAACQYMLILGRCAAENGCLQIHLHAQEVQPSSQASNTAAKVLPVKAGSAIVMCDRLLHCSLPNSSSMTRRAWMPQFSKQPILLSNTGCPLSLAVPLRLTT